MFGNSRHGQRRAGPQGNEPQRETILLVEDEPAVRQLFSQALARAGYKVHEARNGQEALKVFDQHGDGVDLLLTDMRMPFMGGAELARQLRIRRGTLKLLCISGYAGGTSSSSRETFSPSRSRARNCSPRCGRSSTVHERAPSPRARRGVTGTPMRQSITTCALAGLAAVAVVSPLPSLVAAPHNRRIPRAVTSSSPSSATTACSCRLQRSTAGNGRRHGPPRSTDLGLPTCPRTSRRCRQSGGVGKRQAPGICGRAVPGAPRESRCSRR